MKIKIIHLNIERKEHLKPVAKLIEQQKSDILCLCEISENDTKIFAKKFGYHYCFSPMLDSIDGKYGSAILSKNDILEHSIKRYDDEKSNDLPFITLNNDHKKLNYVRPTQRFLYHYALLTAKMKIKNKYITIATTHFPVPNRSSPEDQKKESEYMQKLFDKLLFLLDKISFPLIFTADVNNPRGEYIYDTLANKLKDLTPKNIDSTIDPDLHYRRGLRLVVDTIMISSDIKEINTEVISGISDHKAIISILEV